MRRRRGAGTTAPLGWQPSRFLADRAEAERASGLVRHVLTDDENKTRIIRIDVLRPLGSHLTQPAKASDDRCICRDADYVATFDAKWPRPITS